jgi:D-alanyl-D-alanine carboxypeptidase/D-alanyl-D-alanine-endopeptidase (penicillin-binding protein 4)
MRFRFALFAASCLLILFARGQSPAPSLSKAYEILQKDPQLAHGIVAFTVLDVQTGAVVFDRNGQLGLPAASAQKVVTAATAFDLLGADYRYRTDFGYTDTIVGGTLLGALTVTGSGDPTLGSPRYPSASPTAIGKSLRSAMAKQGIRTVEGGILGIAPQQESLTIPRGWIWEDIANYYGAGHGALNWAENQFDLWLQPGSGPGAPVRLLRTVPAGAVPLTLIQNELRSGPRGSGDEAYLFFNPGAAGYTLRGTIPCCTDSFRISGAVSDPGVFALQSLSSLLGIPRRADLQQLSRTAVAYRALYTHRSPALDSIVYWFLQKSINLYGEALVRTIAREKSGMGADEPGLRMIREHWKARGIDTGALQMADGSGLSPANRVTSRALAQVMAYARKRPWYPSFYAALPVYHGLKMKSGTIGGVKAYAGYAKGKDGKEYAFAIIAHNFTGKTSEINAKLFRVLDAF